MRAMTSVGGVLVMVLGAVVILSDAPHAGEGAQTIQQGIQIPVTTNQLNSENGIVPVELKCENAELSAPNALEKVPCVIKNNTNKPISAGVTHTSITLEKEGETLSSSHYGTFYTYLHPDSREDHKNNFIPPGGENRCTDLPVSFDDGVVVKAVAVEVDYIEFADYTGLGPNHVGSRVIADTREGAVKYKDWLTRKYIQSGRLIDAIVPLLENSRPLPEELKLQNGEQESGANMYRNSARRTYETKGAEGLTRHLERTGASVKK